MLARRSIKLLSFAVLVLTQSSNKETHVAKQEKRLSSVEITHCTLLLTGIWRLFKVENCKLCQVQVR